MGTIVVPGGRDVRGTLDEPAEESERAVLCCPPHPQYGGDRHDARLQAIGAELTADGIACLRIDYGPWDRGRGEQEDALAGLRWLADRFSQVGVAGYSFGAAVGLAAAGRAEVGVAAGIAPPRGLVASDDVVEACDSIEAPLLLCVGTKDNTVEWEPVVERGEARGAEVVRLETTHFFGGHQDELAAAVTDFFDRALSGRNDS